MEGYGGPLKGGVKPQAKWRNCRSQIPQGHDELIMARVPRQNRSSHKRAAVQNAMISFQGMSKLFTLRCHGCPFWGPLDLHARVLVLSSVHAAIVPVQKSAFVLCASLHSRHRITEEG